MMMSWKNILGINSLLNYSFKKFIIWKSDILILVFGNISLTEQQLLYKIKQEVKNLDKNKQIFVIHNLKEYTTEEQVNDYIENTLKKLSKIKLKEYGFLDILEHNNCDNKNYFTKYFKEKNENVSHFIFINEFPDVKSKDYNTPVIEFIQKIVETHMTRKKFSVIDDCKEFLMKISEDIMENKIEEKNLVIIGDEKSDKIILQNTNEINLKSYAVNEVGLSFRNDSNEPKYSCYVDIKKKKLYVNIELPGGGRINKKFNSQRGFNEFTFDGEKYGDKVLENDEKNETKQFEKIINKRKNTKFKFSIEIPYGLITVKPEDEDDPEEAGVFVESENNIGIITIAYDVILMNQKKKKIKDKKTYEF